MESNYISKSRLISASHLATWLLIIGCPVFWLELYAFNVGRASTTPMASILFLAVGIVTFFLRRQLILDQIKVLKKNFSRFNPVTKLFIGFGCLGSFGILICAFLASILPPHLIQEFDMLNYHLTVPRQHLILNTFQHLSWSSADLFLLPVDFALAPYWFATKLPNKFPQFLFALGLISVSVSLVKHFSKNNILSMIIVLFAVLGSHNIGIQLGTAMLDVVMCYLLVAALDSFLKGNMLLSAIEFSFYFWAKPFTPIQTTVIGIILFVVFLIFKKTGFRNVYWSLNLSKNKSLNVDDKKGLHKFLTFFIILSLFVAGPFILKSVYYTGTPLYPFKPGIIDLKTGIDKNSHQWESVLQKSERFMATRNQYGSDRSVMEFLRHFWIIAVPEEGVNNRFDYPVGLMYLLFLGPFIAIVGMALKAKQFPILPFFIIVFWLIWWAGSHQSRFLFVPIVLMFITVALEEKFQTPVLMTAMLVSLLLVNVSVFRAHKKDFGLSGYEVLRGKDKQLLSMSPKESDIPVELDFPDAAYAQFPIQVTKTTSPFVLKR